MSDKKIENNDEKIIQEDPLEELNEIEDKNPTIERENDIFDELELRNADDLPDYNSQSNTIIEDKDKEIKKNIKEITKELSDDKNPVAEIEPGMESKSIMEVIDKVDVNNQDGSDEKSEKDTKKEEKSGLKETIKASFKDNKSKDDVKAKPKVRPKVKPKKLTKDESKDKVIDNVKVDEDGVPLLNQFDTERIKDTSIYNKFKLSKRNVSQIILILIGFIFIIIGIIQSYNDVVKISDNVMYGEHASMAIGLVFVGMLIVILAFYKELIRLFGLDAVYNQDVKTIDDVQDNNQQKKFKK